MYPKRGVKLLRKLVLKSKEKHNKVRVKDIAEVLNISISSVSRALNNHPRISQKTKDRVKEVASELGYNPMAAELMIPDKTKAIIVMLPSLEDELYRTIARGISTVINSSGYEAFIVDLYQRDENVVSILENYKRYGISGIIHIIGNREKAKTFYTLPKKDTLPFVTIFEPDIETELSSVMPDLYEGAWKVTNHLNSNGIGRVALILEDKNRPDDYQIASSFETIMAASSQYHLSVFYANDTSLQTTIASLLEGKNKPEAILVKNQLLARKVEEIASHINLNIPNDLFLIAVGTDSTTHDFPPNLCLLKLPAFSMGAKAAEMLLGQITTASAKRETVVMPVHFILKGSAIRVK